MRKKEFSPFSAPPIGKPTAIPMANLLLMSSLICGCKTECMPSDEIFWLISTPKK